MKFSIVVPVYGVERYLDECLRSILEQTYTDFEVVLVDDCSPDACPKKCDDYAKADPRVKVVHKPHNEGPGYARNTGMDVALGEYVLFVDSDDYLSNETLARCARILQSDVDIFVFGMRLFKESANGKRSCLSELKPRAFTDADGLGKAEIVASLYENRVFPYVWNKLYKRSFLLSTGVQFEKTQLMEDFFFNIALFEKAERIQTVDDVLYFYRKPLHETLTTKYFPEFFLSAKRKFQLEQEFLKTCENGSAYENVFIESYIKHLVSAAVRNRSKKSKLTKKQQIERIKEMMEDPVTVEAVHRYTPRGIVFKTVANLLKKKKAKTFYAFCGLAKTKIK
ncbi:MAG: glycosyltransferase family 2 protein [Clostridia bacterium]|nr:glycosyltransferase family 2 protein [Clostridia bacterium]